jgi:iron complex outermembrane receptor protein
MKYLGCTLLIGAAFCGITSPSWAQTSQDDEFSFLLEPDEPDQSTSATSPVDVASGPEPEAEAATSDADKSELQSTDTAASDQIETIPVDPLKTEEPDPPPSKSRNRLVEEIVVTARKREESIQDVPIAIAAFSAEKLDAVGIDSAQQLDKVTPGLVFSSTLGFNVVFLRGIGTDAYLPAADPSVPIYIDDINVLPTQGSVNTLGNIERVEVLKGPQGTLFGRNSLGGAIRIVTKNPEDTEFFGDVKLDLGNYKRRNISAFFNVPIADGLAAAVSGYSQDEDPYYTHTYGRDNIYDTYSRGGRASLYWRATDNVDLRLTGSLQESSSIAGLVLEGTKPAPIICALCQADDELDYSSPINVPGGSITRTWLVSGQFGWDLPWFDTKLIVSNQYLEIPEASTDLDGTSFPMVTAATNAEYGKQQTAELRFESNTDTPFSDRLTWVAGAYYLKSAGGYHPVRFSIAREALTVIPGASDLNDQLFALLRQLGIELGTGVSLFSTGIIHTESVSGFGQGNLTLLDDLELTLGIRYDSESRTLDDSKLDVQNPIGSGRITLFNFSVPEIKSHRWSPRISLQWNFAEDSQIYTSFAIGYLSPTYNSVNFFTAPDLVGQERSDAYELGFKSSMFSGALKLDGAIFYTKRKNIVGAYTTISSGVAVRFYNAGDGVVKGAELSLQALPLPDLDPGLAIIASASYLDTEYTSFPEGRGYDETTGLGFGPSSLTGQPRDFTGNDIVSSPGFSGTATITQSLPVGNDQSVELAVDTYYNSGFYFTPQNSSVAEQSAYQLFNARISYFFDPWGLQLTAYGENLTKEEYLSSVFQFDSGTSYQLAAPQTYGLRVKWSF